MYRPTQFMIHVHCLIARFQEIILLIVQFKTERSVPDNKMLQYLILRTRSCGTGFITQLCCSFPPDQNGQVEMFFPLKYQLPKGTSAGPSLTIF